MGVPGEEAQHYAVVARYSCNPLVVVVEGGHVQARWEGEEEERDPGEGVPEDQVLVEEHR